MSPNAKELSRKVNTLTVKTANLYLAPSGSV